MPLLLLHKCYYIMKVDGSNYTFRSDFVKWVCIFILFKELAYIDFMPMSLQKASVHFNISCYMHTTSTEVVNVTIVTPTGN